MCKCGKGHTVIVAYMHRGVRQHYLACSHCDCTESWPNFTRTAR